MSELTVGHSSGLTVGHSGGPTVGHGSELTVGRSSDELLDAAVRRVLETLPPADLAAIVSGRARIEVHPVERPRRRPAAPVPSRDHGVDVTAAVARVNELRTPAAVDEYLRDPRFTVPVLKQIARALGPTVLATGRSKAELRRDIAAGTAGFRTRSAAMSGGAWS